MFSLPTHTCTEKQVVAGVWRQVNQYGYLKTKDRQKDSDREADGEISHQMLTSELHTRPIW